MPGKFQPILTNLFRKQKLSQVMQVESTNSTSDQLYLSSWFQTQLREKYVQFLALEQEKLWLKQLWPVKERSQVTCHLFTLTMNWEETFRIWMTDHREHIQQYLWAAQVQIMAEVDQILHMDNELTLPGSLTKTEPQVGLLTQALLTNYP